MIKDEEVDGGVVKCISSVTFAKGEWQEADYRVIREYPLGLAHLKRSAAAKEEKINHIVRRL